MATKALFATTFLVARASAQAHRAKQPPSQIQDLLQPDTFAFPSLQFFALTVSDQTTLHRKLVLFLPLHVVFHDEAHAYCRLNPSRRLRVCSNLLALYHALHCRQFAWRDDDRFHQLRAALSR